MRKTLFLAAGVILLIAACAHMEGTKAASAPHKRPNTVYIWDADGHTDLALLRALKAGAADSLKSHGVAVSEDPDATDAYLKITVIDAEKDDVSGRASIKARLYIIDASDGTLVYDSTFEAKAKNGGYPAGKFVERALEGFF